MKKRVFEMAKELKLTNKEVLAALKAMKVNVTSHMGAVDDKTAKALTARFTKTSAKTAAPVKEPAPEKSPKKTKSSKIESAPVVKDVPTPQAVPVQTVHAPVTVENLVPTIEPLPVVAVVPDPSPGPTTNKVSTPLEPSPEPTVDNISTPLEPALPVVKVSELATVGELAEKLQVSAGDLIKKMLGRGKFLTINQTVSEEVTHVLGEAYGCKIELISSLDDSMLYVETASAGEMRTRPPVVTIMGHVDHGKTSLLDAIRKTNVTAKEAGGITQHIGAYRVKLEKGYVTFIDTPGHEAFTRLRARGAKVTDVVVLVVAADDGVMPQTIEAIAHANAANLPIVVAVNKIDKGDANPDRVKQQLVERGIVPEEWGGKHIFIEVSAKKNLGLEKLLEMLLLEADLLELKACPTLPAKGTLIEAKLDKNRGPVATVLVQNGTLRVGDSFVAGVTYGKVRAMYDDRGERLTEAGPSTPVEVTGFVKRAAPGDSLIVVKDEKMARQISMRREEMAKGRAMIQRRHVTLEALYQQIQQGAIKQLSIILKADAGGSIEAIAQSLQQLSTDQVKLVVLHSGVGNVNESDVMLASASNAIIIGFHVKADSQAEAVALSEAVEIKLYHIIYDVIAEVKAAMEGLLELVEHEVVVGGAEVRKVFKVGKTGNILGAMVTEGTVHRGDLVHVWRGAVTVFEGKISSLKRFQDDVKDVAAGYECGLSIEGFEGAQAGDRLQAYVKETSKQKL